MNDQIFNLMSAVASGMDHKGRERILELFEKSLYTSMTDAGAAHLVDLAMKIGELTTLTNAYKTKDWQEILGDAPHQVKEFRQHYLSMHGDIVDYFQRIGSPHFAQFSLSGLKKHDIIQDRILLENQLHDKRLEIQRMWDFYHEVAALPDSIRHLPAFKLQRAVEYGGSLVVRKTDSHGMVTESVMKEMMDGDDSDPEYVHGRWFLAKLFVEQQPAVIEARTKEVDKFEKSFPKPTKQQNAELAAFKADQDPIYCSKNYQISYNIWSFERLRELRR